MIEDHLARSHHVKVEPKLTLFDLPSCKIIKTLTSFFLLLKTLFPCFFSSLFGCCPNHQQVSLFVVFYLFIYSNNGLFPLVQPTQRGGPNKSPPPPHVVGSTKSALCLQASSFSLGKHLVNMSDPFSLVCIFFKYNCFDSSTSRIQ